MGHSKILKGGGSPKLIKPNLTYQLQTFTKHLTADDNNNNAFKKFIYSGRYLKGGHFEKKLDREGGPFKNAEGGVSKTNSNLTYQLQTFTKHLTVYDNNNNAYWAEILAEFTKFWLKCG